MSDLATQIIAKIALICVVCIVIGACAHDPYSVVVIDASELKSDQNKQQYTVKKGDTLYSIAFRYGTTVYALARSNGLNEPYVIYAGQTLQVANTQPKIAALKKVKAKVEKPTVKPVKTSSTAVKARKTPVKPSGPIKWVIPAQGGLGERYSEGKLTHKGIDIIAPKGSPVLASRAGKVVYAGNGLKAYGLLVIIKHDQQYLSAYAYNQSLVVKEGDTVKQGQKIATVGNKGEKSMLHFEIRKEGKPINPLLLLPNFQ